MLSDPQGFPMRPLYGKMFTEPAANLCLPGLGSFSCSQISFSMSVLSFVSISDGILRVSF